jgi:hypothetical protein
MISNNAISVLMDLLLEVFAARDQHAFARRSLAGVEAGTRLGPQSIRMVGMMVHPAVRVVIIVTVVGHRVADRRAADAAYNRADRAANDRAADSARDAAANRACLVSHR